MTPEQRATCDDLWRELGRPGNCHSFGKPVAYPVWTDDATIGVLLGMAREAWGDPTVTTSHMGGYNGDFGWRVWTPGADDTDAPAGDTEPEALLLAILAGRGRSA